MPGQTSRGSASLADRVATRLLRGRDRAHVHLRHAISRGRACSYAPGTRLGVTRGSHPGHSEEVRAVAADATDLAMNESRARLLRGEGHPCARQSARLSGARAGMAQELATRAAARAQEGAGGSERGVPRTGGICERLIVRQPHGAGTNIRVVDVPAHAYAKARQPRGAIQRRGEGGAHRTAPGCGSRGYERPAGAPSRFASSQSSWWLT